MVVEIDEASHQPPFEPDVDSDAPGLLNSHFSPTAGANLKDGLLQPINWNLLTGDEAEVEWLDLDAWVKWLRDTFGLPPAIIPPYWHRHDELVWELSALHLHWLNSYDVEGSPSAPLAWLRDFAEARNRLREWVSTCGTRLDRDRPTRQTIWPGEAPRADTGEVVIEDRDADFVQFVRDDVEGRRRVEAQVSATPF